MTGKGRGEPAKQRASDPGEGATQDALPVDTEPLTQEAHQETDPKSAEIARLRAREDELLRALAEQQNVLRRRRQEMDASLRYAQEDLLRELLPVLDDFERAIQAMKPAADEPIRAGVGLVYDRLVRTLAQQGLEAMRPVGEKFDPALHDAMAERVEPGVEPGTILEVALPGYRFRDRVIRHAKVVVAGPASSGSATGAEAKTT